MILGSLKGVYTIEDVERGAELRPFLMALTDLDFRHKFVIDNSHVEL